MIYKILMDLAHEPTPAEIKDNPASPHINGEEDRGYEENPSDHAQNDIFKKKKKEQFCGQKNYSQSC